MARQMEKKLKEPGITPFARSVYIETAKIPKGKVSTYSEIAEAIGQPGAARAVGNALNKNPFAPDVPCHRVVRSDGRIGGYAGGTDKKIGLLKKEGVQISSDGKIRLLRK